MCLNQLNLLLSQQTAPRDTAAIIVEPLLGEGGYVPAPVAFLHGLREICDAHGILLIVDEVQSGFARTGKYFALEHSGVRPDIMVVAKVRVAICGRFGSDSGAGYCERLPAERRCEPTCAWRV